MLPKSTGRFSLHCLQLESRETPSATIQESFDTAHHPFVPAAWQQWTSNGQPYYGTSRTFATSGQQALAIYGNVNVTSRLWNATPIGGDATLQAYILSSTPAPVLLFARGSNLDSANASYVGVTTTTGGTITVVQSVDGEERTLAAVTPTDTPATTWLRVEFSMVGELIDVRVQRADTQQYLTSGGQWRAAPIDTINTYLTFKPTTGLAGIGRQPGDYGTAYVDDFVASAFGEPPVSLPPIIVPPPEVVVPPPPVVVPSPPIVVPPIVVVPPPPVVPAPIITPPPVSPAAPVQHYSHIRLAQLAYDTTPVGTFEKDLAANSIDLIVPNPKYFDTFEAVAPNSPKFIYTNVSNLYQELLTSWLSYADANGIGREQAFYHVAKATPFSGSSSASLPVNYFWAVARGAADGNGALTDLTSNARAGRTTGVKFGAAGEAVTFNFPDRFREVNVLFNTFAQAGWSGVWEYVAAVDAAGKPTAWQPLSLVADGTAGLTANGQIVFDPPADWIVSAQAGLPNRLFTIRFRTTSGSAAQAPEAKSILGRDYVNAGGKTVGTIPAFDSQADADGDGHLKDSEYASRRAGFDARFVSETRLFYPNYGQMRFITNPAASGIKPWAAGYYPQVLAANPLADAFFLDNATGRQPVGSTAVLEPTANYSASIGAVVQAIRDAMPGKIILANTTGGFADAYATTQAAGAAFEEFLLRPNDANWTQVGDAADIVRARLNAAGSSAAVILDGRPGSVANMTDPRTQLGLLSYYYLLADPTKTYLMIWGGFAPSAAWSQKWIPAAAVNVGQSTGAMTTFAEGTDPQNDKLTFKVFARQYENALTLFKPRSYMRAVGTGTTENATATTHQLGGSYRELRADGTTGPVIQQITLRNGEGAVLLKA